MLVRCRFAGRRSCGGERRIGRRGKKLARRKKLSPTVFSVSTGLRRHIVETRNGGNYSKLASTVDEVRHIVDTRLVRKHYKSTPTVDKVGPTVETEKFSKSGPTGLSGNTFEFCVL